MSARVRHATEADLDRLAEIESRCFGRRDARDALAAELSRSWAKILVAEVACEGVVTVAAFLDYWRVADEVEVLYVATDPDWRRQGLAAALLDALLDHAALHPITALLLEVRPSNHAAVALYHSRGFVTVGARARYYDDGEDAWLMRRSMTPPVACG